MSDGPAETGALRPVLVTRPTGREGTLVSRLTSQGLRIEHQPLIRLVLEGDSGRGRQDSQRAEELRSALTGLAEGAYTHLVLTSRTAVEALGSPTVPASTQVVAVGGGTAEALTAAGVHVDHIAGGSGAALVEEMPAAPPHASVLFPASAAASRTVPDGLTAKGYRVHEVTAYHPEMLAPPAGVVSALRGGEYSAIVLTSPMIARAAAELGVHPSTAVVTIGDPTSAAARAAGLTVAEQAAETTDEALARAVQTVLGVDPADPPVPIAAQTTVRP